MNNTLCGHHPDFRTEQSSWASHAFPNHCSPFLTDKYSAFLTIYILVYHVALKQRYYLEQASLIQHTFASLTQVSAVGCHVIPMQNPLLCKSLSVRPTETQR